MTVCHNTTIYKGSNGSNGVFVCHNTTIYNGLLRAIDEGRPVIFMNSDAGDVNYVTTVHVFSDATIGLNIGQLIVTPSDGYSSSDLYTPRNITPTDTYTNDVPNPR